MAAQLGLNLNDVTEKPKTTTEKMAAELGLNLDDVQIT
jgi:hypothetical protein